MRVGIKCYINHSGKYGEINFIMKIPFLKNTVIIMDLRGAGGVVVS